MTDRGILVGSDTGTESLLPWWWERYSCENTLPVAFVDFGMTQGMRKWCSERGEVISCLESLSLESACEGRVERWTAEFGDSFLRKRNAWFKKPSACLLSPFDETAWLDLDCEVLSNIEDIFSHLGTEEIAVNFGFIDRDIPEIEQACREGTVCNSGVLVFKKGSSLLSLWAEKVLRESSTCLGDECLLSLLIAQNKESVHLLPDIYNWKMARGIPVCAKIIHWKGEWGKKYIAEYGGLKPLLMQSNYFLSVEQK